MTNEVTTPAPTEPTKPILFSDIQEQDIELPSDEPKLKKVEPKSGLEEDDTIEAPEEETEETESDGDAIDTDKKRIGEDELVEDEEEGEEETESEEEEEGEGAEKEYTEMSTGGLTEALNKLAPKELEKVLGDIQIPVRAEGRNVNVPLSELRRSYASKAATTSEFYKVKEWRDKIRTELAAVNDSIGPAWKSLKEKKVEPALLHLAKLAGFSTLEVKRQLRAEMAESVINYAKMTPEQRKQFDLEEEVQHTRQVEDERKKLETQRRAAIDREQARYKFQAQHGISDEQFEVAKDWLLKNRFGGDESKLTPNGILDFITTSKAVDTALALVERERPSLKKDDAFVDRVVRLCKKYPTAPWAQLAKKVQEIASEHSPRGEKNETELKKDISRKVLKTKPKAALENPAKQNKPKAKTFDDVLP